MSISIGGASNVPAYRPIERPERPTETQQSPSRKGAGAEKAATPSEEAQESASEKAAERGSETGSSIDILA